MTLSRDELVDSVVGVVKALAQQLSRATGVDVEELTSDGYLGAIDAADRFDQTRGVKFSTFAAFRIKGAMIDGLRERDFLSRSQRAASDGDDPRLLAPVSLNKPTSRDSETTLADSLPESGEAFDDTLADHDALSRAMRELPTELRQVLHWHYWAELTLAEIAEHLGVTESRVCQIEGAAMHDLRVTLTRAGIGGNAVNREIAKVVKRRHGSSLSATEHDALYADVLSLWTD